MPEVLDKKREVTINPTRCKLAEYVRQSWCMNAELGTTIEDIQKPVFWTHIAEQMHPYDHVEVRVDDGAWIAYMLVTSCGRNWAKVKMLQHYDLTDDAQTPANSIAHEVQWKGPQHKWTVIRISDGAKLKTECESREVATAWLIEHERSLR